MNAKQIMAVIFIIILGATYYYLTLKERPDDLIAIVGSQKITIQDYETEMKRRSSHRIARLNKKQLLDEMILRSSMVDQALQSQIHQQKDFIRMYENLLIGQYKKQFLKPQVDTVDLTSEEIQRHYSENINKYTQPKKIRLALIHMKTHAKMNESKIQQISEKMNEALNQARKPVKGRGFGRLAVQYSEDQVSRYKGGDIGWIYENRSYRWDEKVLNAGFALTKIDDVSDIITTDKGLYIVKLMDRRPSVVTPFNKVKTRIRHKQLLEKRKETEKNFEKRIREKTPVTIYQDVFDKVKIPEKQKENNQPPVPF